MENFFCVRKFFSYLGLKNHHMFCIKFRGRIEILSIRNLYCNLCLRMMRHLLITSRCKFLGVKYFVKLRQKLSFLYSHPNRLHYGICLSICRIWVLNSKVYGGTALGRWPRNMSVLLYISPVWFSLCVDVRLCCGIVVVGVTVQSNCICLIYQTTISCCCSLFLLWTFFAVCHFSLHSPTYYTD